MSQYFPKLYEPFGRDINVKVNLTNFEIKADIKNVSHIVTSSFALKSNLTGLKTEVNKLDIDKLVPVLVGISKLNDVVKTDVVKKAVYDKLVAKINNVDTSGFVLKTNYDTDKKELKEKFNIAQFALSEFFLKANSVPDKAKLKKKIPEINEHN